MGSPATKRNLFGFGRAKPGGRPTRSLRKHAPSFEGANLIKEIAFDQGRGDAKRDYERNLDTDEVLNYISGQPKLREWIKLYGKARVASVYRHDYRQGMKKGRAELKTEKKEKKRAAVRERKLKQQEAKAKRRETQSKEPKRAGKFKGVQVWKNADGTYSTDIDRSSKHDTLRDAQNFIISWKSNPKQKSKVRRNVDVAYTSLNKKYEGKILGTFPKLKEAHAYAQGLSAGAHPKAGVVGDPNGYHVVADIHAVKASLGIAENCGKCKGNPPKFERCVKDVKKSLKKYKRPGNAYAICTKAGTRNVPKTNAVSGLERSQEKRAQKYRQSKIYQAGHKEGLKDRHRRKPERSTFELNKEADRRFPDTAPYLRMAFRQGYEFGYHKKNPSANPRVAKMTQGTAVAEIFRRKLFGPEKYEVMIRRDHIRRAKSFASFPAAQAWARLTLHDVVHNPNVKRNALLNEVRGRNWIQASYETGSRELKNRAKELRKKGYRVKSASLGNQVTQWGTVKVTLLDIRPGTSGDEYLEAVNPVKASDLVPGSATIGAYVRAGHLVVKGVTKVGKEAIKKAQRFARRNPLELAQQRHEEFTGFPSEETLEIIQRQHVHTHLVGLAQFVSFNLIGVDGKELPPLIAPGMKYTGPQSEILFGFKGKPKGDWKFEESTPAGKIVWLTASEQRERGGSEMKQQLYLSGGDQKLDEQALKYLRITSRDMHDNVLIGTIVRVWYWTRKTFEDDGKSKVWFFHDFGKEGSDGVCPVLIYHPLDPGFEIAGGRYSISLPKKELGGVSPGIIG